MQAALLLSYDIQRRRNAGVIIHVQARVRSPAWASAARDSGRRAVA